MRPGASGAVEPYRFTVSDYHRMAEAGILPPGVRVELLAGEIVRMSPIGRRHAAAVRRLDATFQQRLAGRCIVQVQNPVHLDEATEPEPDVTLLRVRPDYYASAHPGAGDTLLIIEVAESSARVDREVKRRLYAAAGVPEYWVVDLDEQAIDVFTQPAGDDYASRRRAVAGEVLAPASFPDGELDVREIAVIA